MFTFNILRNCKTLMGKQEAICLLYSCREILENYFNCFYISKFDQLEYEAVVAEWLRRLTRNQFPSGSAGSNPADCEHFSNHIFLWTLCSTVLYSLFNAIFSVQSVVNVWVLKEKGWRRLALVLARSLGQFFLQQNCVWFLGGERGCRGHWSPGLNPLRD